MCPISSTMLNLYIMHPLRCCRCMLVMVNPAEKGSQEVSIPMAERAWREAHTTGAAAQTDSGVRPSDAVPEVDFDIVYVRSAAEASRAIQNALLQLRWDSRDHCLHPAPFILRDEPQLRIQHHLQSLPDCCASACPSSGTGTECGHAHLDWFEQP